MVHDQQQGRTDDCHQQAVEVESANTRHPESGEEPASDDCADDTENDVHHDTLARPADDLAGDEPGDESKYDPC